MSSVFFFFVRHFGQFLCRYSWNGIDNRISLNCNRSKAGLRGHKAPSQSHPQNKLFRLLRRTTCELSARKSISKLNVTKRKTNSSARCRAHIRKKASGRRGGVYAFSLSLYRQTTAQPYKFIAPPITTSLSGLKGGLSHKKRTDRPAINLSYGGIKFLRLQSCFTPHNYYNTVFAIQQ